MLYILYLIIYLRSVLYINCVFYDGKNNPSKVNPLENNSNTYNTFSSLKNGKENENSIFSKADFRTNIGYLNFEKNTLEERQRKIDRRKERKDKRQNRRNKNKRKNEDKFFNDYDIPVLFPGDDETQEKRTGLSGTQLVSDSSWLESNISSIWSTLRLMQKDLKQVRRQLRNNQKSEKGSQVSSPNPLGDDCDPTWVIDPQECQDEKKVICGNRGTCSCGQCVCQSLYYGSRCTCNDMACDSSGGVLCGGAGRGQCRCGSCVCRPEYSGKACECARSTRNCQQGAQPICSSNGKCVCNRCQCQDGFAGQFCSESIFSASMCERLKPCVLCKAYHKSYPRCNECNIQVKMVKELESTQATCIMVNLGCILEFAYVNPQTPELPTTVLVKKQRSCP